MFGVLVIIMVMVCLVLCLKHGKRTVVIQQPYVVYNNADASIYNQPTNDLMEKAGIPSDDLMEKAGIPANDIMQKAGIPADDLMEKSGIPFDDLMEKAGIPTDEEANGGVTDAPPKYEYKYANPNANENGVEL